MKLTMIMFDGVEHIIKCKRFEFRSNSVNNWIKIIYDDDSEEEYKDIAVVKSMEDI